MMSASHLPIAPPADPISERPRRTTLTDLGDVLWLSYYHLIDRWRRTRLDGFVSRPVHTIDLATVDGHRLTLPTRRDRVEVRVLRLRRQVPDRAR
ncbi:hypothetical protein [Lentzea albidocapillata]|uniref:Uncharacterized protein n=1 Tax=Lentzea albidocapillata TaxID=40571 RepID=A0A1W2DBR8_9PSEU|nr:hypothetical protein [Lentzea albidocapillata]SMC94853.1 hypothetical protein SAMN05660733_02832 [Lentzea albidocapillata]